MQHLVVFYFVAFISIVIASSDSYFKLPIKRSLDASLSGSSSEIKRDDLGPVAMKLKNNKIYYLTDIYVGSNRQSFTVLIDTASSDLWVPTLDAVCLFMRPIKRQALESELAGDGQLNDDLTPTTTDILDEGMTQAKYRAKESAPGVCTSFGYFNPSTSTTFKWNNTIFGFKALYSDLATASGAWGHDDVGFGNVVIPNFSFAVANATNSEFGVLGIGHSDREWSASTYENFPMRLKSMGIIASNSYSLFLSQQNATEGTILFGAVDHAKYIAPLQKVPIIPTKFSNPYLKPQVILSEMQFQNNNRLMKLTPNQFVVVLDSASTYSYLPGIVVARIAKSLDGTYDYDYSLYKVDCEYKNPEFVVMFDFSGIKIRISLDMLMFQSGSLCWLSLFPVGEASVAYPGILGENFLRHAYVVYDLDNLEISMAPVVYTNNENIEVIRDSVPSALSATNYLSTQTQFVSAFWGERISTYTLSPSEVFAKTTSTRAFISAYNSKAFKMQNSMETIVVSSATSSSPVLSGSTLINGVRDNKKTLSWSAAGLCFMMGFFMI